MDSTGPQISGVANSFIIASVVCIAWGVGALYLTYLTWRKTGSTGIASFVFALQYMFVFTFASMILRSNTLIGAAFVSALYAIGYLLLGESEEK